MENDFVDLLQLQALIKEGIEEAVPDSVWVKAEISSFSPRANGHCYLTLSQSSGGKVVAECRAMIWKWNYPLIKQYFESETGRALSAGITVLVKVAVNYSPLYGVSLYVEDIDPSVTLGESALLRQRTIDTLVREGYMEMQKELVLPELPSRLAVISSATAAGYGDFRRHLLESPEGYVFKLDLYEALMQGESAPPSIISALVEAGEKDYDAVLILRGGGSETDLACFDDYTLAVAIATCPLPVVTAIGHDRDFHVADMVANQYVKTPTALSDLFLERFRAADAKVDELEQRIISAVRGKASLMQERFSRLVSRLSYAFSAKVQSGLSRIDLAEARISASDPRHLLSKGYALVTGPDGRILKSASSVVPGDRIGVRFSDGRIDARVEGPVSE